MAIPVPVVNTEHSRSTSIQVDSPIQVGAAQSSRSTSASAVLDSGTDFSPLDSAAIAVSSQRTRAALLELCDRPDDHSAMDVLWQENYVAIKREMTCHLKAVADSVVRERMLSGVVSHSKFFCDEFDDPKAWVARCANLEARRFALQSIK